MITAAYIRGRPMACPLQVAAVALHGPPVEGRHFGRSTSSTSAAVDRQERPRSCYWTALGQGPQFRTAELLPQKAASCYFWNFCTSPASCSIQTRSVHILVCNVCEAIEWHGNRSGDQAGRRVGHSPSAPWSTPVLAQLSVEAIQILWAPVLLQQSPEHQERPHRDSNSGESTREPSPGAAPVQPYQ